MRIAQVAPLYERVPPLYYGGTERVVSYLTEELVAQGHEITLFASGDSLTQAKLVSPCAQSLRLNRDCRDYLVYHVLELEQVFQRAHLFDIVHFHIDYFPYPFLRRQDVAHVTTLHGRLDMPDLAPLYREFCDMPAVSISDAQRTPLAWIDWQGTVYHGLPRNLYKFNKRQGKYLAFLGRISPEKRLDRAIEIAKRANMPLKLAAKIDAVDRCYMEKEIRPLLDHPLVEFLGEIDDASKSDFLGNAYALLFPIDWPEPFGLVMTEAMACGTPTVAFRHGSVPEVLDDQITGYVVDDVEQAVEALKTIRHFDRARCRRVFEERFSVRRMAQDYVKIYQRVIDCRARAHSKPARQNGAIMPRRDEIAAKANGAPLAAAGSAAISSH